MVSHSGDTLAKAKSGEISADEVIGAIEHKAGFLPQIELAYESAIKTLWVTLLPEPKPVFTYDLLRSLNAVHRAIWTLWGSAESYTNSPVRYLAFRGRGPVLTLGGDLDFYLDCLAKGDREALSEYARASAEGVCWNASSSRGAAITLSTVQGKAYGGGIDAPCSCNVMIAEQQATFCYPEVKFNHFPITAVGVLTRRVGARTREQDPCLGQRIFRRRIGSHWRSKRGRADGRGRKLVEALCSQLPADAFCAALPVHGFLPVRGQA